VVLNLCSTVSGRTSTFVGALWSFLWLLVFLLGYDCPPSMDSHSKARRGRGSVCLEYACSCLPYNRFWIPLLLLAKVCVKPYLLIDDSSFIYYVLTSQG
jgi:hypothetical protein